ncbi:universal stress protein [Streptomyces sp. NPDC006458]|uniref:universal stress protein n=1 Tax=Streptomyces sp. NPDC006458 TaxID=3154302 RepID=UPI0033BDC9A7
MQSPLVVGVDGSDGALVATDWAVDEAVRHGISLRIVYASLWEHYEGDVPAWSPDRPSEQVLAENIAWTAVEHARRRASGLVVSTEVLPEDAAAALLSEGAAGRTVVVGSRGRGGLADLLLGSVGLVVAARSPSPVVVVRGERAALESRHERVLLGVGGADIDAPAVHFAFGEAAARGCELDVVTAWRRSAREPAPAGHPLMTAGPASHLERRAARLLDKAIEAASEDHAGVRVRRTTLEGPARTVLVQRSAAADLLVIGARRRAGLVGMELGAVAHRALHHAACPVAVVPQGHRATADTRADHRAEWPLPAG